MGTSYTILKKDGLEVSLDEHSNVLDLALYGDVAAGQAVSRVDDLTPAELVAMALEMLQVASYWMDDDAFKAAAFAKMGSTSSYLASYMREIGNVADPGITGYSANMAARASGQQVPKEKPLTVEQATKAGVFAMIYGTKGTLIAEKPLTERFDATNLSESNPPRKGLSEAQLRRLRGGVFARPDKTVTGRFPKPPEEQDLPRRAETSKSYTLYSSTGRTQAFPRGRNTVPMAQYLRQYASAEAAMAGFKKHAEELGAKVEGDMITFPDGVDYSEIEARIDAYIASAAAEKDEPK